MGSQAGLRRKPPEEAHWWAPLPPGTVELRRPGPSSSLGSSSPQTSCWLQGGAHEVPVSAAPRPWLFSFKLAALPPMGAVRCLSL